MTQALKPIEENINMNARVGNLKHRFDHVVRIQETDLWSQYSLFTLHVLIFLHLIAQNDVPQ